MRISRDEKCRILITGSTGCFGAHFAKLCLDKGHDVFSIEHNQRPHDSAELLGIKNRISWARGDVRDSEFLSLLLASADIQMIAHFAAKPLVRTGTFVAKPIFDVNCNGTVALLDAAKQVASKRGLHFLMISTDKVYGNAGDHPYTEDMPLNGSSVYEASKVAAEAACRAYQSHGFVPNLVISRSCNVVGPGDLQWRLIPNTVRQFLTNSGAKAYTHGQWIREYAHVQDIVQVQYELMMRANEPEYRGQAFNLGSGFQASQEQVINHIRDQHFPDGQILRVEPPPSHTIEISYQRLDCTRVYKLLGWRPQRTFEQAVADVVAWWREHKALAPWSQL